MAGKDGQELMKNYINSLLSKKYVGSILYGIVVWGILSVLFMYFLEIDISEAPTFIYSQF